MTAMEIRRADAKYKPFPPFPDWSDLRFDSRRWDEFVGVLKQEKATAPEALARALEVVRRAAAVETGAIEGLYDVDRGFTFTVAMQTALWEVRLAERGRTASALIKSQLEVYEELLDLATNSFPLAEAVIRKLHEDLCRDQDTYVAYTEIGRQELSLPKGRYKSLPNHVITPRDELHAYAPVDETAPEMHRLIEEIRSETFLRAHPVLQASYAHYAFVVVHPFADGNGRVARALASIFTYRSHAAPVLILADNREEYFRCLAGADAGNWQLFVDFIFERSLDAVGLVQESLRAAGRPSPEDAMKSLERTFQTRGGYSHVEVDAAGLHLMRLLAETIGRRVQTVPPTITVHQELFRADYNVRQGFRRPVAEGPRNFLLNLSSQAPAQVTLQKQFSVEVPEDCGRHDGFALRDLTSGELFEARASELIPQPTAALQMRLALWVESILGSALQELAAAAAAKLHQQGY